MTDARNATHLQHLPSDLARKGARGPVEGNGQVEESASSPFEGLPGEATATRIATKWCPRCEQTLPLTAFGKRTVRGLPRRQPYCKPCILVYHHEWRRTPTGRAKFNAAEAASKRRYPERERARRLVTYAVKRGTLVRGPCEQAGHGCGGQVQAHHDDYSQPLRVRWLCKRHHSEADLLLRHLAALDARRVVEAGVSGAYRGSGL
jgi:hypothetical protein